MASIEEALVAAVQAAGGVTALIGNRFFLAGSRQGAVYPYATYQRISTAGAATLDGTSTLDWPRMQIDVWAEKPADAIAASEALRAALDGQSLSGAGIDFYPTLQDLRGPAADEVTQKFNVQQDYYLWHER